MTTVKPDSGGYESGTRIEGLARNEILSAKHMKHSPESKKEGAVPFFKISKLPNVNVSTNFGTLLDLP